MSHSFWFGFIHLQGRATKDPSTSTVVNMEVAFALWKIVMTSMKKYVWVGFKLHCSYWRQWTGGGIQYDTIKDMLNHLQVHEQSRKQTHLTRVREHIVWYWTGSSWVGGSNDSENVEAWDGPKKPFSSAGSSIEKCNKLSTKDLQYILCTASELPQ